MAGFFGWGVRQWEFVEFRIDEDPAEDPDVVEEKTIESMEADGWEYIATRPDHMGAMAAVFKRPDGVTTKRPQFPVWAFRQRREAETASGIDRSAKMTDAEKLGKGRR